MKSIVYMISGSLLAGICIYAVAWLKYKKLSLFKPISLDELKHSKKILVKEILEFTPLINQPEAEKN